MEKLTLEQIIDCLYDRTIEPSDGLKLIEELNEQQCDYVQQLFTRPQEVFKPLQKLYRKENPHPEGKFYIPDATKFFQWIANKVNEYEFLRNSEHLLNIPCVSVRSEQLTAFCEWLEDNHSIKIHDMILQDYLKYGG